jgi:undecaprenyl pyrophosphate phosphatase UppP
MVTSAVTGYIAINLTLKTIKKANYKWFSIYLIAMAIVSVAEIIFKGA